MKNLIVIAICCLSIFLSYNYAYGLNNNYGSRHYGSKHNGYSYQNIISTDTMVGIIGRRSATTDSTDTVMATKNIIGTDTMVGIDATLIMDTGVIDASMLS